MVSLILTLGTMASLAAVRGVVTGPAPDTPDGEPKVGDDCIISWKPDPSGVWKKTYIELMAGENLHMQHITSQWPSYLRRKNFYSIIGSFSSCHRRQH